MGAIRTAAAVVVVLIAAAAAAADCVTDVRTLSTRVSVPNLVAGPSSWNGTGLAVAKTEEGVPGAVWVGVYDESMQTLVEDRRVATDARALVALLWNGSEHGLFYTTVNDAMFLQRLSAAGEPIGARVAITPGKTFYSGDDIDVVWSAALNAYAVGRVITQGQFRGVWLTLVERSGAERSDRTAGVAAAIQPALDLAVTDSGIIGMFFNNALGSLVFARAAATGPIEARVISPGAQFLQAEAHRGLFVVVRNAPFDNNNKTEIRWVVVDSSQQIVRADARLVAPSGDDAWPLAMISNGEELALAYIDAPRRSQPVDRNLRLLRFDVDGTVISNTFFSAATVAFSRAQSPHPFAWTGTSYLAPVVHAAPDRMNSYLLRYCPLRATIVSPTRTVRVGQNVTFSATATGGVPGYQYSWTFPSDEVAPKRVQTFERSFPRTGTYTVTLEVTDFAGATTTEVITINVVRPKTRAVRH